MDYQNQNQANNSPNTGSPSSQDNIYKYLDLQAAQTNPQQLNNFQVSPNQLTGLNQNGGSNILNNITNKITNKKDSELDKYLASSEEFKKSVRDKKNKNSTQNILRFAEIRDDIVIMNDGSYRAVVKAKSINYDLMSSFEQESVELGYQGFLNNLQFPTQIYIRSRKIDMGPYLEKLSHIRMESENMLLGVLMEDYIGFISELVQQTNIMSKAFYIIVPYYGLNSEAQDLDSVKGTKSFMNRLFNNNSGGTKIKIDNNELEKAKIEVSNRVQNVINGLLQMGIQSERLNTKSLIELYYNCYNPDTATRQTLDDISNLNAPVIEKGDGHASQDYLDNQQYSDINTNILR